MDGGVVPSVEGWATALLVADRRVTADDAMRVEFQQPERETQRRK